MRLLPLHQQMSSPGMHWVQIGQMLLLACTSSQNFQRNQRKIPSAFAMKAFIVYQKIFAIALQISATVRSFSLSSYFCHMFQLLLFSYDVKKVLELMLKSIFRTEIAYDQISIRLENDLRFNYKISHDRFLLGVYKVHIPILRRPQNFEKSPPYF